ESSPLPAPPHIHESSILDALRTRDATRARAPSPAQTGRSSRTTELPTFHPPRRSFPAAPSSIPSRRLPRSPSERLVPTTDARQDAFRATSAQIATVPES